MVLSWAHCFRIKAIEHETQRVLEEVYCTSGEKSTCALVLRNMRRAQMPDVVTPCENLNVMLSYAIDSAYSPGPMCFLMPQYHCPKTRG
jgi:hypothetical protein